MAVAAVAGNALRARASNARMRRFALFQACLVLTVGVTAFGLVLLLGQQRNERAQSIQPQLAKPGSAAKFLVSFPGTVVYKDKGLTAFAVWPLADDSPPPPGVDSWPEPGSAWLSPEAQRLLAPADHNLFGEVAGTIDLSGLETPTELRVYWRPSRAGFNADDLVRASGWGATDQDGWWGLEFLNAAKPLDISMMFAFGVILPALVAVGVAANLDGERRVRRARLLTLMGAQTSQRLSLEIAESWRTVVAGVGVGASGASLVCLTGLNVPVLDFSLPPGDMGSRWWVIAAAALISAALSLCVLVGLMPRRWGGRRRRRRWSLHHTVPNSRVMVCGLASLGAVVVPGNVTAPSIRVLSYFFCVSVVAVTLPTVVSLVVAASSHVLTGIAWNRAWPGVFLGSRHLEWSPSRTARLSLAVCVSILLLGQLQLWTNVFNGEYDRAVRARAALGTSVVQAQMPAKEKLLSKLKSSSSVSFEVVWFWRDPVANGRLGASVMGTSCAVLNDVIGKCDAATVSVDSLPGTSLGKIASVISAQGSIRLQPVHDGMSATPPTEGAQMFLVSPSGSAIPVSQLERIGYQETSTGVQIEELGQGWLVQGELTRIRALWVTWWAQLGVLTICVAASIALAGDFASAARRVVPLAALSARRGWLYAQAICRVSLPISSASIIGSGSYLVLAAGVSGAGDVRFVPSWEYAAGALTAGVLASLVAVFPAAATIRRMVVNWRPGGLRE